MKKLFMFMSVAILIVASTSWARMNLWIINGANPMSAGPDVTAPTVTEGAGTNIDTAGTLLTVAFSEAVSEGSGYSNGDWTLSCSTTGPLTVSHTTGNGTSSWGLSITGGPVQYSGTDTCTLDWAGTANGVEDGSGNDLAAIDPVKAIVNNSTQGAPVTPALQVYFDADTTWGDGTYTTGGSDDPDSVDLTVVNVTQSDLGGGDYAMLNPVSASGSMRVPLSAKNYFDSEEGCIDMVVYATITGTNYVFEARDDSNDYFYIELMGDNTVYAIHRHDNGAGVGVSVVNDANTDTCTDATDCRIQVCWSVTNTALATRVCADGTCDTENFVDEADADTLSAGFNDSGTPAEPTLFYIGEFNGSIVEDVLYKEFKIYTSYVRSGL